MELRKTRLALSPEVEEKMRIDRTSIPRLLFLSQGSGFLALSVFVFLIFAFLSACASGDELARGRYLVEALMACDNCHTPRGPDGYDMSLRFSGGTQVFSEKDYIVRGSNISPDHHAGIGAWSDARIRAGYRRRRRPHGASRSGDAFRIVPRANAARPKGNHRLLARRGACEFQSPTATNGWGARAASCDSWRRGAFHRRGLVRPIEARPISRLLGEMHELPYRRIRRRFGSERSPRSRRKTFSHSRRRRRRLQHHLPPHEGSTRMNR